MRSVQLVKSMDMFCKAELFFPWRRIGLPRSTYPKCNVPSLHAMHQGFVTPIGLSIFITEMSFIPQ